MMKLMSDWGFTADSWKGERGEYLLLAQAVLMIGYVVLPVYRPSWLRVDLPWLYGIWAGAGILFFVALVLIGKGLLDLGQNLTPLPYPRASGQLVQTGIYSLVRHPLYSGISLAAKAYAIGQLSLSHLIAMLVLFGFLNLKASREETWLSQRFPDYASYQQRVKKLIPWVY